jgi:rhamnosyltransferase
MSCGAVIVTYQPSASALTALLARIQPQVTAVLVVDNASQPPLGGVTLPRGVERLSLTANVGLAAAQNHGIAWAQTQGFTQVLLLDQDSLPAPDMVARLATALTRLQAEGMPVAAVGPCYRDARTGAVRPFARFGWFGVRQLTCAPGETLDIDLLIASGSLIPLSVLAQVGLMEAGLFIDNVDLEWGFRAQHLGLRLYGVGDAWLDQRIGDTVVTLWFGRWRQLYCHAPVRQYYQTRNRLRLYRRAYVPRAWVWQDSGRMLVKLLLYTLFIAPRGLNLWMFLRGLYDGWRNREGKIPL